MHGSSVPAPPRKGLGRWEGDSGSIGCPAAPWGRAGATWGGSCNDGYGQRMGIPGGSGPTAGAKGVVNQVACGKPCWVLSPAAFGWECAPRALHRGVQGMMEQQGPVLCHAGCTTKETEVLCFAHCKSIFLLCLSLSCSLPLVSNFFLSVLSPVATFSFLHLILSCSLSLFF